METSGGAGGSGTDGRLSAEGRRSSYEEEKDESKEVMDVQMETAVVSPPDGEGEASSRASECEGEQTESQPDPVETAKPDQTSQEDLCAQEGLFESSSVKGSKVQDVMTGPKDVRESDYDREVSIDRTMLQKGTESGDSSSPEVSKGASISASDTTSTYLSSEKEERTHSSKSDDSSPGYVVTSKGRKESRKSSQELSDASPTSTEGRSTRASETSGRSSSTSHFSSSSFGSHFLGTPSVTTSTTTSSDATSDSGSTSISTPTSGTKSTDAQSNSTRDTSLSLESGADNSTSSSVHLSLSKTSGEYDLSRSSSRIEIYDSNGSNGSGYLSSIESNTSSASPPRDDHANGSNNASGSGKRSNHCDGGSTGADKEEGDVNGNNGTNGAPEQSGSRNGSDGDGNGNGDTNSGDEDDNGNHVSNGEKGKDESDETSTDTKENDKSKDDETNGSSSGSSGSYHIRQLFRSGGESPDDTKGPSEQSTSGSYRLNMLYSPQGSSTSRISSEETSKSSGGSVNIFNNVFASNGGSRKSSTTSGSNLGSLGSHGKKLFKTPSESSETISLGSFGRKLFGSSNGSSDSNGKVSDNGSLGSYGRNLFRSSGTESSGKTSDSSSLGSYGRRLFSTTTRSGSSESSANGSKSPTDSNGSIGQKHVTKSLSGSEEAVAGAPIISSPNEKTVSNGFNGSSSRSSTSNGLSWITITPAQSPIQPIMEVFPPPQVPVMSRAVTPQTPLISTIAPLQLYETEPQQDVEDIPSKTFSPSREHHEIGYQSPEEPLIIERTDSLDTVQHKPYHDSSTTMGSSSDNLEASEHQPLLDSTDSGVDHSFIPSGIEAADQLEAALESIDHPTRPMLDALSVPVTTDYVISPTGVVTTHGHPLGSSSLGHSSGLVPLQLLDRQESIASYALAGQGLLTTVQSIDQPTPPPDTQPVLAPLQLPQQVLSSPVTVTTSTLMAPTAEDLPPVAPSVDLQQVLESGPDLSEHPRAGEAWSTEHRILEDVPETTTSRPSRNLHLDLGWVWGQDATKMQAPRPKRHRIRRAQAMPISPHVGPLSSDMDTADSGLGTADGDMMFGAPYSSELPTSADITANTQTNFMLSDKWKSLFDKYDPEGQGEVSVDNFRSLLEDVRFRSQVAPHKLEVLENLAGNGRTTVSYHDLVSIMSNKRRRSFTIAVHCRDREVASESDFQLETPPPGLFARMVRRIAKEFLTDERDRQYYADHYTCWPPPLFVPTVTLIEVGFFVYYCVEAGDIGPSSPVPANSMFIYRPDKRIEIWRFFFYMLIHAGWVHLFFNMLVQLLVGIPLEMVHGSFRIGTVYMAGVLAGSLGTSVFDMDAFLVGASGGVYALLAAHLANILLNYSEMELGIFKLVAVFMIASADVGFAIWDRYSSADAQPPVGYVSHLMGALAGLTIGLLVLKNFQQKLHAQVLWWVALGVYTICTVFAILWNIFYY